MHGSTLDLDGRSRRRGCGFNEFSPPASGSPCRPIDATSGCPGTPSPMIVPGRSALSEAQRQRPVRRVFRWRSRPTREERLATPPHSGTPRERVIASNGDESIELRNGTRFAYVKIGRQRTIHRRSPLPDLRCVWFASNRISCKGFVNRPGGGGSIRCERWPEMWTPLSSFHRRSSSSKRVPTTGDDGERN